MEGKSENAIGTSIGDKSLAYWSGRAQENSALHMSSYKDGKAERFRARIQEAIEAAPSHDGVVRALVLKLQQQECALMKLIESYNT